MRSLFADNDSKAVIAAVNWKNAGGTPGTGALTLTSTANEFSTGGQGLKFVSSTVSAELHQIHRWMTLPNNHPIVIFGGMFAMADKNLKTLSFEMTKRDGTKLYRHRLKYTSATNVWSYADDANAEQTIATRDMAITGSYTPVWHRFILAADYSNATAPSPLFIGIDEVLFNKNNLPAALYNTADTNAPNAVDFLIQFENITGSPSASTIFIDNTFAAAVRTRGDGGGSEEGPEDAIEDAFEAIGSY